MDRNARLATTARAALDALLPRACAACEAEADGPLCALCSETLGAAPAGTPALLAFGGALQRAINAAKQGPDLVRARALGALFAARAAQLTLDADTITFVPAPFTRLAWRGFDLPAVLARALADARGLPFAELLAVTRADRPLSAGASRDDRARLVQGRFRIATACAGQRVALVDDVHTTGATLGEARRVLEDAGARVVPIALAAKP